MKHPYQHSVYTGVQMIVTICQNVYFLQDICCIFIYYLLHTLTYLVSKLNPVANPDPDTNPSKSNTIFLFVGGGCGYGCGFCCCWRSNKFPMIMFVFVATFTLFATKKESVTAVVAVLISCHWGNYTFCWRNWGKILLFVFAATFKPFTPPASTEGSALALVAAPAVVVSLLFGNNYRELNFLSHAKSVSVWHEKFWASYFTWETT